MISLPGLFLILVIIILVVNLLRSRNRIRELEVEQREIEPLWRCANCYVEHRSTVRPKFDTQTCAPDPCKWQRA